MRRFVLFMLLLVLCVTSASAHPGRTDSQGGHYDRSTGQYHWHHGMSAHQHYDMDGDGILDCPYTFKGTTAATTSPDIYTTTITTAPATFSTWATTAWTSPSTSTPDTAAKEGGNDPMIGWIVSAALVIALYGSSKSHEKESNLDLERIRKQNQEISTLKKELEAKDKTLTDLDTEMTIKIASLIEENAKREETLRAERSKDADSYEEELLARARTCATLRLQLQTAQKDLAAAQENLNAIYAVSEPSEGQTPEEHAVALALKISELEGHIQELSYELDKHIRREAAPSEVFFASDGLPILCKSLAKKYGDYTAYLNRKSEIYHLDPSCAPAGSPVVHLFNVPRNYRACSRCALGISRSIPGWYK